MMWDESRMEYELLRNLHKLHTTELGIQRIKKNLNLDIADENVVEWCKEKIKQADDIQRRGKNWYVYVDGCILTVNAGSFTVITGHLEK